MKDIFRPRSDPAQLLYDTFQKEADKRPDREWPDWHNKEIDAVYYAAIRYAQHRGWSEPTRKQVSDAEISASGHTDYGSQWAYGVSRLMETQNSAD